MVATEQKALSRRMDGINREEGDEMIIKLLYCTDTEDLYFLNGNFYNI